MINSAKATIWKTALLLFFLVTFPSRAAEQTIGLEPKGLAWNPPAFA